MKTITPKGELPLSRLDNIMDYSNYPSGHEKFDPQRKNVVGFFKDETKSQEMTVFVGCRSKCYTYKTRGSDTPEKTLKGITKPYKKTIPFEAFRNAIFNMREEHVDQYNIRSRNHVIRLTKLRKKALSGFDDKRHLLPCGIHSYAYGHRKIRIGARTPCEICEELRELRKKNKL